MNVSDLTARLGLAPESEADHELERQVDIAVDLIEVATSDEEMESGIDALAKLVKARSDGQVLRSEIERQEAKRA